MQRLAAFRRSLPLVHRPSTLSDLDKGAKCGHARHLTVNDIADVMRCEEAQTSG